MKEMEMLSSTILDDMSDIQARYKVHSDRFAEGIEFALACTTEKSSTKAFRLVFGADKSSTQARRFLALEWVGQIVKRFAAKDFITYYATRSRLLEEMASMAMDGEVSAKVRVEAASLFLTQTKMPDNVAVDITIDVTDEARQSLDRLFEGLSALSKENKMITASGEVIDVVEML